MALLPLTIIVAANQDIIYGFYLLSTTSSFIVSRLPLTLIALDDWALSTITGVDSEKYIQGQVTADVSQMTEQQHLLAAHCDAKGKMWSTLRLFRERDGFAWIERRSVREAQLTELKKYAVFSKVVIAPDDERVLLGVAGFQARAALANVFSELPNSENQVVRDGASTLLWFEHPAERFCLSPMSRRPTC